VEFCDGEDNDCDGEIDEAANPIIVDGVRVETANRCGRCGPEPEEVCDGRDNDCDGDIDEERDPEICDGVDNDCDRQIDEGHVCCEAGQVAVAAAGACREIGACVPIPEGCPDDGVPVCGCDNQDYANACQATVAGVTVWRAEPCNSDPCDVLVGQCGPDGACICDAAGLGLYACSELRHDESPTCFPCTAVRESFCAFADDDAMWEGTNYYTLCALRDRSRAPRALRGECPAECGTRENPLCRLDHDVCRDGRCVRHMHIDD